MTSQTDQTREKFTIKNQEYEKLEKLGEGAFGKVFKIINVGSREVFAMKEISFSNRKTRDAFFDAIKREVGSLIKCDSHENIISLLGVSVQYKKFLLLMEYCSDGNLNSRLARHVTEEQKLTWMSELADAVQYLHLKEIVHRDLKPENVLLSNEKIKLADFGLARDYCRIEFKVDSFEAYLKNNYMGKYRVGTGLWMAPEVFAGKYTEKADVFSLGAIFYTIQARDYIFFQGEKFYVGLLQVGNDSFGFGEALHRTRGSKSRDLEKLLDDAAATRSRKELIKGMLVYDKDKRSSAKKVYDDVQFIIKSGSITLTSDNVQGMRTYEVCWC